MWYSALLSMCWVWSITSTSFAEGFPSYTSAEKLQYVLSRLRIFTAELGCDFDEAALTERIEADIAFSKEVNADKSERLD